MLPTVSLPIVSRLLLHGNIWTMRWIGACEPVREIVAPQRIEQILVVYWQMSQSCSASARPCKRILGEGAAQLVHHAALCFLQRDVSQGRQLAGQVAVDHNP